MEKKIEFTLVDVLSMQNINNCLKCMLEAPDKVGLKNDLNFFYFSKNIHVGCDPSFELSQRDGSGEGSRLMFFMERYSKQRGAVVEWLVRLCCCAENRRKA